MFKRIYIILLGSSLVSFTASPVMATNKAMLDLIKILRDKGSINAAEYELLKNTANADNEKVDEIISEAKNNTEKMKKNRPRINTNGKFEIKQGNNKIRIGGRLQYDTTFVGNDGTYSGFSESQFRRARIYLSGTWDKYWDFKFQYDIEDTQDNDQAIEDAYIKYKGWPVHITLGQRKSPYSMEELTSSKYITFIERSFVSELFNNAAWSIGNRNMGITLTWDDMKKSGVLVEAGYTVNRATAGGERSIDDGHGFTGRIVWADYDKKATQLIHVGFSGGVRHYPNNNPIRVRVRPNVSEGSRMMDTGNLAIEGYHAFNINVAGMHDRFWAAAEYFYGKVDLIMAATDDDMSGFIIQGGVFLTAEDNRRYKKGTWDSVNVKNPLNHGGIGAWEVAFRYDQATLGAGIQSDDTNDEAGATFTAALNWYPINNVRLQANYVTTLCDSDDPCDWDVAGTESNPDFFIFRAQTFF